MIIPIHKIFIVEEFFGCRIYNTKSQIEHLFDKKETSYIKKIYAGKGKRETTSDFRRIKNKLIRNGLITTDISWIKNKKTPNLSAPSRVSLNITRKCNLQCRHCLSNSGTSDKNELTTQEIFKLIDQMREMGSFFLAIGGGEPLIRKDIFRIIKYARKNYISVSLVTNALLVNKKIAQRLNDLNLNTISVSADGLEENYEFMRGKGNFNKVISKIKFLRKYIKTAKLAMRVTVNSRNIDECPDLIKLAEKLSLDEIRLTPILPIGRATANSYLFLNQNQFIDFIEKCRRIKAKVKTLLPNAENKKTLLINPNEFGCHCGKEICWITQTGDFYPCIFFGNNYLLGNIRKDSLVKLWYKSKQKVNFAGNVTCKNCLNYINCRGGCRCRALWFSKNINTIDPYCILRKNLEVKKMRKPTQVLIFPFIKKVNKYYFAIFQRKDMKIWQGLAGGCEKNETPLQAMRREAYEEATIAKNSPYIRLSSMTTIPAENIHGTIWGKDIIMIPEVAFGIETKSQNLELSNEHSQYIWLTAKEAIKKLKYDSNKSAIWELNYRLNNNSLKGVSKNIDLIKNLL